MKIHYFYFIVALVFITSCKTATYHFNKAEKQMEQGEYAFAVENYKQAINKGASKKECSYKIATAYRLSNQLPESAEFYKIAIDEGTTHETAYLYYGLALKAKGQYKAASQVLENYSKIGKNTKVVQRAKIEFKNINQIDNIADSRFKYEVKNFGTINDEGDDYAPAKYGDKLVFASARGESKMYGGTGFGFSDLYSFTYDDVNSKTSGFVKKFDETNIINLDYTHEAEATFTPDGKVMVFARSNDGSKKGDVDVQLYQSKLQADGNWSEPVKLEINDLTAWNGCPSFSKDGKHLYFGSTRANGKGGIDLYSAEYSEGKFLHVKNLGPKINSYGNEMFPFEREDGTLFFASDGLIGYGGLDLFRIARDESGRYISDAENLGRSINSTSDDFGMMFDAKKTGFFCSNRAGGKGQDDIYRFEEIIEPYYYLNAHVRDKATVGTDSVKYINHAKIMLISGEDTLAQDFTDTTGYFSIKLEKNKTYALIAQKDHYFSGSDEFIVDNQLLSTLQKNEDGDYEIPENIDLEKIELNKSQNITAFGLKEIYYDLNKADIREDAAIELNKLAEFMKYNPGISLELSSHTDSRGTVEDNQNLSQRRADSAVAYIIRQGIEASRIVAKGYGESKIINKCKDNVECKEEEHQLNRRTEISVTDVKNKIAEDRELHEKTKLEQEIERKRLEELRKELEEGLLKEQPKTDSTTTPEKTVTTEEEEYQKYLEMKKKMEQLEQQYKEKEKVDEKK